MQGLTLGLSGGMTCTNCGAYAPPVVQAAVHMRMLGVPIVLWIWLLVIIVVSFVLGHDAVRGARPIPSATMPGRVIWRASTSPP